MDLKIVVLNRGLRIGLAWEAAVNLVVFVLAV